MTDSDVENRGVSILASPQRGPFFFFIYIYLLYKFKYKIFPECTSGVAPVFDSLFDPGVAPATASRISHVLDGLLNIS